MLVIEAEGRFGCQAASSVERKGDYRNDSETHMPLLRVRC